MAVRVTGTVQRYAWGDPSFIPTLLGTPADGGPHAEWWLGTHPLAPSVISGTNDSLASVTGEMSMLVKVLSCTSPLSLQTHPDASQARTGFARENAAGLAMDDPARNYRDANAKPEMLIALTPFDALCGFDDIDSNVEQLKSFGWHEEAEVLDMNGTDGYVLWAFDQQSPADVTRCPQWLQDIAATYPGDRALRVAPLLNRVHLEPGEAIVLPAGNLHAYLKGSGLEVMGSSDNVLRAGFTTKHIDVSELQRVMDSSELVNPKAKPEGSAYTGPGGAFSVERITLNGSATVTTESVTVLVRTDGVVDGLAPDEAFVMMPGESLTLEGKATLWACRQG